VKPSVYSPRSIEQDVATIELQLWDGKFAITAFYPTLLFARVTLVASAATRLIAPDKPVLLVVCVALP
jgi:hypothetical protein